MGHRTEEHTREKRAERQECTSLSIQIEEERLDSLEERVIHRITPLGVTCRDIQRPSTEGALLLAGGKSDSSGWNHSNHGRDQPSDPGRRDVPEPLTSDTHDQTGYSRTVSEPPNRYL